MPTQLCGGNRQDQWCERKATKRYVMPTLAVMVPLASGLPIGCGGESTPQVTSSPSLESTSPATEKETAASKKLEEWMHSSTRMVFV